MKIKLSVFFLAITLILAACGGGSETPLEKTLTPTPEATATITPIPLPDTVVLVTQGITDPSDLPRIQQAVSDLAVSSGFAMETRDTLTMVDLGSHLKIVIFLAVPADLANMLAAAPQTQFVVFASSELIPAANLSVIQSNPQYQAFLAGYASAILAADWRAAGLLPTDASGNLPQVFENGGNYYCGTCSPIYPPYVKFPLVGALPSGSDANAWIGAASQLIPNTIHVFYVAQQAASAELYNYLVSQNVFLLGGASPLPEAQPRWAGTIREDIVVPLQALWPQLTAGTGGQSIAANLIFTDVNPGFLSEGRLNAINEIIPLLRQGLILPTDLQ